MFNPEKLLGKIVGEVVGKGSGSRKGGGNSMLDSLTSGSGLMTMLGLGVGAYEILKQQGLKNQAGGMQQAPPPPPPPPGPAYGTFGAGTPPPPSRGSQAPPPLPSIFGGAPAGTAPTAGAAPEGLTVEGLAVRMIQVMVAAAHADGTMDQEEERAVLDKLRGADLSQEEKMFLLDELHQPKSIEMLTAGINNPSVAKTLYMLAVAAIEIDTESERAWLDQLARELGLSKQLQSFIEEQR